MINYDTNFQEDTNEIASGTDMETEDDEDVNASEKKPVTSSKTASTKLKESSMSFLSSFSHVLQFCYLCTKGKIPPLLFTVATDNKPQFGLKKLNMLQSQLSLQPYIVPMPIHQHLMTMKLTTATALSASQKIHILFTHF
jgi:hypothetical protein